MIFSCARLSVLAAHDGTSLDGAAISQSNLDGVQNTVVGASNNRQIGGVSSTSDRSHLVGVTAVGIDHSDNIVHSTSIVSARSILNIQLQSAGAIIGQSSSVSGAGAAVESKSLVAGSVTDIT